MGESAFPNAIKSLFGKLSTKLGLGQNRDLDWEPDERVRVYEPMPSADLPSFDNGPAPRSTALADTTRLRAYYAALQELSRIVALLNEEEDIELSTLFLQVDALIERQVPELPELAGPVMTILADSPEWSDRRWAMHALVAIARVVPEMAGSVVPGFLAHIEVPTDVERDIEHLSRLPKKQLIAEEFGFLVPVAIRIELPFPVGQYLQDVALEGLDQLSLIVPDFAQDAFSVLEALSKEPTKAGERAGALLGRLHLGERLRRVQLTEDFLSVLTYPSVIAVSKSKKYHYANCRFAQQAVDKEGYLFLNAQEASEFGYGACNTCKDM
jgi:hypothetical protein